MIVVGIDPGAQPVACVYFGDPAGPFEFFDGDQLATAAGAKGKAFPHSALIRTALAPYRPDLVVLEHVQPMPAKPGTDGARAWGISSTARFIGAFRYVQGVVEGLGYRLELVRPQTWQPLVGMRQRGPEASRLRALELFPAAAPFLSRKKDHNRAAALLLAYFGHIHILSEASP